MTDPFKTLIDYKGNKRDYEKSGSKGDFNHFLKDQADLYKTAQEGDPRLKTTFYDNDLKALKGLKP